MANIVFDGLTQVITENRLAVKSTRDVVSVITLIDILVILPSFLVFIALDLRNISNLSFPLMVFVPAFLLSLPLAIVLSGLFFSKKAALSSAENKGESVVPIILFLLFIFSMFGIYTPIIAKLALIIPSLNTLYTVESAVVLFFLVFVIKSVTGVLKN